ncbi:DUF4166 domain-containing protein [Pseudaestuariivita sp.]|uniref:DUF4166 domain-containing protein n=1 Tax=Pseudaestuariivita sp. TaxID=2211669 RepID=UPI00405A27B9
MPTLQALHQEPGTHHGVITVTHGPVPGLARLMGFPPPCTAALLTLTRERHPTHETWTRQIGTRQIGSARLISTQRAKDGLVIERMGMTTAATKLTVTKTGLRHDIRQVRILGVPVPRALAPGIDAREWESGGLYHFAITVTLPLTGTLLARYSGYLEVG